MNMKELSIEEKAKRYDKALEKARKLCTYPTTKPFISDLQDLFPELIESEDEKIRKWLIALIKSNEYGSISNVGEMPCPKLNVLDWLEKQGEQKIVDEIAKEVCKNKALAVAFLKSAGIMNEKGELAEQYRQDEQVEPKFKNGNWIVYKDAVWKVCNISLQNYYELLKINNEVSTRLIEDVDENAHEWTIQDAKDGDVLINKNYMGEHPFIFKEIKPSNIKTNIPNPLTVLGYCGIGGAGFTKGDWWGDTANCIYYPATKEQRDLLFQKMREAGYEWDAEKKELRKIEQKSAWSEEDERNIKELLYLVEANYLSSEEPHDRLIKFLKSLRLQSQWKPSDEQMDALRYVTNFDYGGYKATLVSLYEQLKKLREE